MHVATLKGIVHVATWGARTFNFSIADRCRYVLVFMSNTNIIIFCSWEGICIRLKTLRTQKFQEITRNFKNLRFSNGIMGKLGRY